MAGTRPFSRTDATHAKSAGTADAAHSYFVSSHSNVGFVNIAPAPVAAVERLHDGVLGIVEVLVGVLAG